MNTASAAATESAMTRRAGLPLTGLRLPSGGTAESGCQRHVRPAQLLDPVRGRAVRRNADAVEGQEAEAGERGGELRLGVLLVCVLPRADDLLGGGAACAQPPVEHGRLLGAVGDHLVVAAPPELDRRAAARDRVDIVD